MLNTTLARGGLVTAPHQLASSAGRRVLAEGGNAAEAMIAAAAVIAIAYPHMNGLGGDNFWLLRDLDGNLEAIEAAGPAAEFAELEAYGGPSKSRHIAGRGPKAALTVAGAISGWKSALDAASRWGGRLPLSRLLEEAIHYARNGIAVTKSQSLASKAKLAELKDQPGFAPAFLGLDGNVLTLGANLRQPRLAASLEQLVAAGLDDFYRGDLARSVAADLEKIGSPLRLNDLETYSARKVSPLSITTKAGRIINLPPPTQGLASLLILGIFDCLAIRTAEDFTYLHGLIEATKRAFIIRDTHITDPRFMTAKPSDFLTLETFAGEARQIDPERAAPWPQKAANGDTVWLGAIDRDGRAVSMIQSLYWEY
ncbi:MAG: gamma-glutamyltransferase, partial [Kiloniellales bacterium]|nr:gamma-glutamyltransferase [Kiloniellales bacterium]